MLYMEKESLLPIGRTGKGKTGIWEKERFYFKPSGSAYFPKEDSRTFSALEIQDASSRFVLIPSETSPGNSGGCWFPGVHPKSGSCGWS